MPTPHSPKPDDDIPKEKPATAAKPKKKPAKPKVKLKPGVNINAS